jgi:hypothetical protein
VKLQTTGGTLAISIAYVSFSCATGGLGSDRPERNEFDSIISMSIKAKTSRYSL